MREAKVIINVPGCWHPNYVARGEEILNTWAKHTKYPVIISVANQSIQSEYVKFGNQLHCKVEDTLDFNFTLKRYYFIKWAVETKQEFDFLYIVGDDTFVYPSKFEALCNEYLTRPDVDYIGEVFPRVTVPVDFLSLQQEFIHPGAWWNFGHNNPILEGKVSKKIWETNFKTFAGGGAGYVLSKKACKLLYDNFHLIEEFRSNYGKSPEYPNHLEQADDLIIAETLHKLGIFLHHDNRFNHFSPRFSRQFGVRHPFIEEPDSIAVCQHGREGEMQMILDKLGISHNYDI